MDRSRMIVCLLWGLTFSTVSGVTVPCMVTREDCQRTGFNSISIINNHYRCCAPGYSMSMVNGLCSCTKFSEAMPCSKGPCGIDGSMTTDWEGNAWCCPPGYGMSSQSSVINGAVSRSCSCTKYLWNGGSSIIVGNGMVSGTSGDVNSTALAQRMQAWRQRFQNTMARTMQQTSDQMLAMTSQMTNQMNRMRNHMASVFGHLGNVFRGW